MGNVNISSLRVDVRVHGISSLSLHANGVIAQSAEAFHASRQIPLSEVSLSQTPPSRQTHTTQESSTPRKDL